MNDLLKKRTAYCNAIRAQSIGCSKLLNDELCDKELLEIIDTIAYMKLTFKDETCLLKIYFFFLFI